MAKLRNPFSRLATTDSNESLPLRQLNKHRYSDEDTEYLLPTAVQSTHAGTNVVEGPTLQMDIFVMEKVKTGRVKNV